MPKIILELLELSNRKSVVLNAPPGITATIQGKSLCGVKFYRQFRQTAD